MKTPSNNNAQFNQSVTTVILAGGKSKRFGSPKALAQFEDKTLIERAVDIAQTISSNIFIVTGSEDLFSHLNVRFIKDIIPGCGPLGGIHTALIHSPTPWIATLPCDMPKLTAEIYVELFNHKNNNQLVVAASKKGLEPLVALWSKDVAATVQDVLNQHIYEVRACLQHLPNTIVDLSSRDKYDDHTIFFNVNYQHDIK